MSRHLFHNHMAIRGSSEACQSRCNSSGDCMTSCHHAMIDVSTISSSSPDRCLFPSLANWSYLLHPAFETILNKQIHQCLVMASSKNPSALPDTLQPQRHAQGHFQAFATLSLNSWPTSLYQSDIIHCELLSNPMIRVLKELKLAADT